MISYAECSARERLALLLDEHSFHEWLPPAERLTSPHLAQLGVPEWAMAEVGARGDDPRRIEGLITPGVHQFNPQASAGEVLGMSLAPLTPDVAQELGAPDSLKGLVVQGVDPEGAAADKGLAAGDVITEVGQKPVTTVGELQAQVKAARDAGRKSVLVLVNRQGEPRFVALPLGDK